MTQGPAIRKSGLLPPRRREPRVISRRVVMGESKISHQRIGAVGGNDTKSLFSADPVYREIGLVDGENGLERLSLRQIDKRRVCEIHRPITISRHKCIDMLKFRMLDCCEDDDSRPKKPPSGLLLRPVI